jgi:hypothetical protein
LADRLATLHTILDALSTTKEPSRAIEQAIYYFFECEPIPPEGIEIIGRRVMPSLSGWTHMRDGCVVDGTLAPPYMTSLTDVKRLIEPRISPLWDWCVDRAGNANIGPIEARNCHYVYEQPEVGLLIAFLKLKIAELEGSLSGETQAEAA